MDGCQPDREICQLFRKNITGIHEAVHSSIGTSPNTAWNDKSTHPRIRENLQKYYDKFTKTKLKFKLEDIVRIKLLPKSSFHKGYDVQNNQAFFEIYKILKNRPIPMYQIRSIEKSEGIRNVYVLFDFQYFFSEIIETI